MIISGIWTEKAWIYIQCLSQKIFCQFLGYGQRKLEFTFNVCPRINYVNFWDTDRNSLNLYSISVLEYWLLIFGIRTEIARIYIQCLSQKILCQFLGYGQRKLKFTFNVCPRIYCLLISGIWTEIAWIYIQSLSQNK